MNTQDFNREQLFGRWRTGQGAYSCDWVLQGDGTFSAKVTERGKNISHSIGTWSIDGVELVSIYTKDEFDLIGPGHRDRDKLLEVTDDYFILKIRQGIRRRYERVHESKSREV